MARNAVIAVLVGLTLMLIILKYGSSASNTPQTVPTTSFEVKKHNGNIMVYVTGQVQHPGVVQLQEGLRTVDAIKAAGGFTEKANQSGVNLAAKLHDEQMIHVPAIGEATPTESATPKFLKTSKNVTTEKPEGSPPPGEQADPPRNPDVGAELTPAPSEHFEGGIIEAINSKSNANPSPAITPVVAASPLIAASPAPAPSLTPAAPATPAASATPEVAVVQVPAGSKVSLNRATIEQLESVPGLNARLAADIVAYRRGPPPRAFTSIDELAKVPSVKKANFDQASPYLKL